MLIKNATSFRQVPTMQKPFLSIISILLISLIFSVPHPVWANGKKKTKNVKVVRVKRMVKPAALDPTFGIEGFVVTSVGRGVDRGEMIALGRKGEMIVAGVANYFGESDFAVVRYRADGHFDPNFGINGRITTDLGGEERVYGLVLQKDGKIIVAGYTKQGKEADFALVRYNALYPSNV